MVGNCGRACLLGDPFICSAFPQFFLLVNSTLNANMFSPALPTVRLHLLFLAAVLEAVALNAVTVALHAGRAIYLQGAVSRRARRDLLALISDARITVPHHAYAHFLYHQ